ncbi:hypothetical protein EV702DRAFT_771871 [Suillus placidus]|uniref:Uncharacterized protein n=1 Tax=Suillus placidus TaxID=48579 RepID=A0A9P7A1G1_9AGAM|nr:hypothetical protein EV702DRAFT_771871 [Suillus placidus]
MRRVLEFSLYHSLTTCSAQQLHISIASDMETTAEQQTTELSTDVLASKDSHDETSATPCAYTQVLVDPLCMQDKSPSENHQLAEESVASQLPPDLSLPLPKSSDLKDPERHLEPMTSTSCSTAMSGFTTNEGILQTDETLNASLSPFISRRGTLHVELIDTDDLQMIRLQSSGVTTQSPRLQSCEADEEAPSHSSLDNARSSSLPPSSSPPQIFSSSPLASSQSSLIETGDHYKVADRAITMESDDQDLISSPDRVYPDTLEEVYNDHNDTDAYQQRAVVRGVFFGSPVTINCMNYSMSPTIRKLTHYRRSDPGRKESALGLHAKDVPQSLEDTRSAKRMKTHDGQVYRPPAPKRATLASQQRQFKKLIAPFRSPLILNKDEDTPSEDLLKCNSPLSILLAPPSAPKMPLTPQHARVAPSVTPAKTRVRTLKAASQFKSPLTSSASASSGRGSSIRLTPTVQSLERKLQLLKRAVKVKENDEEKTLVRVIKKWTEAGREVAYELWDLVKDSANKDVGMGWDSGKGKMGSRDSNWGWASPGIKREGYPENEMNTATENALDEGDTNKILSEDDEQSRNTMGTMLRQFGIATETLGWDEDAEVFFD